MSLVLANTDADSHITYVFNGVENVRSAETILSGTQVYQNVDLRRLSFAESYHFQVSAGAPRAAAQTQEIYAFT